MIDWRVPEEVVYDECLVAVPDSVEVHVVVVVAEEEQGQPGGQRVHGDNKQDPGQTKPNLFTRVQGRSARIQGL